MKTIRAKEILFFYDLPQLILGEDIVGGMFLCLLVENTAGSKPIYLCTPVAPNRVVEIKHGELDIRTVFINPELREFFTGIFSDTPGDYHRIEMTPFEGSIAEEWLPDSDLFIPCLEPNESLVLTRSIERNRGIIHLRLDPPESYMEHRILVESLAPILISLQSVLKNAYFKICATSRRLAEDFPNAYQLRVSTFAPGSFVVELESSEELGLFGDMGLSPTLNKLDELVNNSKDLEIASEYLKKNRGRLAQSYLNFLKLLRDRDISLDYVWATPCSDSPKTGRIHKKLLRPIIEELEKTEKIGEEEIQLLGYFTKVDTATNAWRISNEPDGRDYSGNIEDGSSATLKGVIVEEKKYRLFCRLVIEDTPTIGQERTSILLYRFEEA